MKQTRKDKRDRNAEQNQLRSITRNAEQIQDLISNAGDEMSEDEKARFARVVNKMKKSYETLTQDFLYANHGLEPGQLDGYFDLGSKISELSDDLIKLISENDLNTQKNIYSTSDLIENTCDDISDYVKDEGRRSA